MLTDRRIPAYGGLLLIALVALAPLHASRGTLSILWRYAVLSWDNPASLVLDGQACITAPCTDPAAEARGRARFVPVETGRLVVRPEAHGHPGLALASGITRSPPAA